MSIVGTEPIGDVFIENFDQAVFDFIEGEEIGQDYFLRADKVDILPPLYPDDHGIPGEIGTEMPGIPIIFSNPDDPVIRYVLPCIRITPEDPSAALERKNGIHSKWRGPADGSTSISVDMGSGRTLEGFTRYAEQSGADPYDMPYTISSETAGKSARTNCHKLLRFIMKKFTPNGSILVRDSNEEDRWYPFFTEGPSQLSAVADIADRSIIYALSVRILGELDLYDPTTGRGGTILSPVDIRTQRA